MVNPTKPRSAGSKVIAANMAMTTASDVPTARPCRKLSPMRIMPSTEIITVKAAKTTARPELFIASMTAASGDRVRWSAVR